MVESSLWRSGFGHCDKCTCAAVQTYMHVLFHCQDLALNKTFVPFTPIFAGHFLWRPLVLSTPCLIRLSLYFFSQRHNNLITKLFHSRHYGLHFGRQ